MNDAFSMLPWWYRAFPLWVVLALPLWVAVLGRLATWLTLRGFPQDAHWTERARHAFPMFTTLATLNVLGLLLGLGAMFVGHPVTPVPMTVVFVLGFVGCITATLTVQGFALRQIGLSWSWRDLTRGLRLVLFFQWLPIWGAIAVSSVVRPMGEDGAVPRLIFALAVVATLASGVGAPLMRWVGLAKPAGERLDALVKSAAAQAGLTPRFVYELDLSRANAFALTTVRGLLVTRALLEQCDDDEVRAVLLHEFGHLKEPLRVRAFRQLTATALFALGPICVFIHEPLGMAIAAVLTMVMVIALRRVARRMEEHADEEAHSETVVYARALERIYQSNLLPAVTGRRGGVHPDLFDRMTAAGLPPSFERPAPPPKRRLALLVVTLGVVAPVAGWVMQRSGHLGEPLAPVEAMWLPQQEDALVRVARWYAEAGDFQRATALLEALLAETPTYDVVIVGTLADLYACDLARKYEPTTKFNDDAWSHWAKDRIGRCAQ